MSTRDIFKARNYEVAIERALQALKEGRPQRAREVLETALASYRQVPCIGADAQDGDIARH